MFLFAIFTYDTLIKLLIDCLLACLACLCACWLDRSSISQIDRSIGPSVGWLIDVFMTFSCHSQQSRIRNITACYCMKEEKGRNCFLKMLPNCGMGRYLGLLDVPRLIHNCLQLISSKCVTKSSLVPMFWRENVTISCSRD